MRYGWILFGAVLFTCGCNPVEKALDYDWSVEGPVQERMVVVRANLTDPPLRFAAEETAAALREKGHPVTIFGEGESGGYSGNTQIAIQVDPSSGLRAEGYQLVLSEGRRGHPQFVVTGSDAAGAMYGGLYLAEAIRIEPDLSAIQPVREEPYLARRGLKISIPSAAGGSSGPVRGGDSSIKNTAEMSRFDFWRELLDTMARYRYNVLVLRTDEGLAGTAAAFRKNTDLWRKLMDYAKGRCIHVYLLAAGPVEINRDRGQPLRDLLEQLKPTFPGLAGVGASAGEEEGRVGRIVRAGREGAADPAFRYSRSRLYASPAPPFYAGLDGLRSSDGAQWWWDLDNNDIFVHRWGDPDYVRQYLLGLPGDVTAGYFVGSDGYVLGREFLDIEQPRTRPLEIAKHWYCFLLWGRLGYNPNLDRAFFEKVLSARFPTAQPALLYEAWQASSKIIPLVNRFHWRDLGRQWFAEACMGADGFHTVRDFIDPAYGTMPGAALVSIAEAAASAAGGSAAAGTGPLQVADQLEAWAEEAIALSDRIQLVSVLSAELAQTLEDIEAIGWLGKYYAAKIRGSYDYAMYKITLEDSLRHSAVEHLRAASDCWRNYARKDTVRYRPQNLARTGRFDWWEIWEEVKKDIDRVRKD